MIGVTPRPGQIGVVEEFFEIFKTPWELCRPQHVYDAVIVTANEAPKVNTKLLLVCGSVSRSIDLRLGIIPHKTRQRALLSDRDGCFPIYDGLLTFAEGSRGISCLTTSSENAGLKVVLPELTTIRLGYDLFDEVQFLLSDGQPLEYAHIPTLEIHIRMLRAWILDAGIPLLEVPPVPARHRFIVCLTHDIDFVGIRNHLFDHSMWGFVYRATVGSLLNLFRRRLALARLLRSWLAVLFLPLVFAGWMKDFWEPFGWYLEAEKGLPATYFLIPFKRQPGEKVPGRHASRRAAAYDVSDLSKWTALLRKRGCEIGVHGIDAWHDPEKGHDELGRIKTLTGESASGVRIHWLLRNVNTPAVLEQGGYAYDSTFGYNETVGYRAGTCQVFRPLGAEALLELPLHIQDGALFYPQRLNLTEQEAERRCKALIENASKFGGVLTTLWHDRSHGPERFWGDFYIRLLNSLKSLNSWFGTANQIVTWFRKRREVRFERLEDSDGVAHTRLRYDGEEITPPLNIRVYLPRKEVNGSVSQGQATTDFVDLPWNGKTDDELGQLLQRIP